LIIPHFETLEKAISEEPLIVSFDLHRNYTSAVTAYIKAEIIFTNGTRLALFQHVKTDGVRLFITDYRYHYMTADDQMIFRYDNAPHHPGTENFPHHKHTLSGIISSDMPEIRDVMNEITSMILSSDSDYYPF